MKREAFLILVLFSAGFFVNLFMMNVVSADELPLCEGPKVAWDCPCESRNGNFDDPENPWLGDECGYPQFGKAYCINRTDESFRQCNDEGKRCVDSSLCQPELCKLPEVGWNYEPGFVKDTIENRFFDPRKDSPTPFDDILILFHAPSVGCIRDYFGEIFVKDQKGNERIIRSDVFSKASYADQNKMPVYSLNLNGWSNERKGWTQDSDVMNLLLSTGSFGITIYAEGQKEPVFKKEIFLKINSCLKLWGEEESKFNFATLRTTSASKDVYWVIGKAEDDRLNGYFKVDPYKFYKEKFSFFVDLKEVNDRAFDLRLIGISSDYFESKALEELKSLSSCNKARTLLNVYSKRGVKDDNGYTERISDIMVISVIGNDAKTTVHESAHAFFGLSDEYGSGKELPRVNTNCFKDVSFLPYGSPYLVCSESLALRTSKNSIMGGGNQVPEDRPWEFNLWSCGLGVKRISPMFSEDKDYAEFAKTKGLGCIFEAPDPNLKFCTFAGAVYPSNLQDLDLSGKEISDISCLKDFTSLKRLSLGVNKISDISPLSNLVSLTYLSLKENQISDISPLKNLKNLEYLQLSNNKILDISSLNRLVNLKNLWIEDNLVEDISALGEMKTLKSLRLFGNKISDISSLKDILTLGDLDLTKNQISSIDSLKIFVPLNYLGLQVKDNLLSAEQCNELKEFYKLNNPEINIDC